MQGPTQTVSVDTFLLLSGLLVAYTLLRDLDRNEGKFNVFLFYLNRYIRYIISLIKNCYFYISMTKSNITFSIYIFIRSKVDAGLRNHFGFPRYSSCLHLKWAKLEVASLHGRGLSVELVESFPLHQ